MKLNRLFLLAAMGLGLFACNDNDLVEGSAPNGTQEEGTTYVGFSLKFNDPNTRATKTEDGNPVEQKINTAYVMMADASGNVEQIVSTADRGKGDNNTNTNYYVFQTTAGVHYFYAVVNPDIAPTMEGENATAKTISTYFNTGVALTVANITSTADGGNFMMASENVLTADVEDGVTKDEALKGTKNCFAINVERVAAKVTMTCEKATLENAVGIPDEPEYGGKVSNLKFNLKGVANMAYRMAQSEWKNIPNNSWTPNEDGTVNNNTLDVSVVIGQDYKAVNAAYCLENINTAYKQSNTTYLNLYTKFVPAKVVDCDSQETVGALKDNPNAANPDPKAVSFYVVKTGSLAGNYILKSELDTFQGGDDTKFPNGVESISAEYKEGTCWFGPIWIGQTNAADQNGPVVRNTWYNLNITGIALPGEPQEPQPDPDQPLVPATNVAISLSVMPWNFINREIDLQ